MARRPRYSVNHDDGPSDHFISILSDGNVRCGAYAVILGIRDTPANGKAQLSLQRVSGTGSGATAITPEPLDPLTAAAQCSAFGSPWSLAATPDFNTELLECSFDIRKTFRWRARAGREIWGQSGSDEGLLLRMSYDSGSPNTTGCVLFKE